MSVRFFPPSPAPDAAVVRDAWSAYVAGTQPQPARVRPHVLRAWERSLQAGCSPHMARADVLPGPEREALLHREQRLVAVATPFLVALSRAAGPERHAAMLADAEGRLLKIVGDRQTMADESFPHPGALLSETNAGANGIGTTLAEGHYVELVGPEHWIEGFHVFTCQGVPLLGPDSRCGGALSMSVRRVEAANRVRDILFCASEAAECELLASWLTSELAGGQLPQALERLREDMIQRITIARLQLEVAARRIAEGADATTMLSSAQELGHRFRQLADTWRGLVGEGASAPEPILLGDLVRDLADLLATEARVTGVPFEWGRVEPVRVLDGRRALTRRLLDAFLSSIQAAAGCGPLRIEVTADGDAGTTRLSTLGPNGQREARTVRAPRVR